MFRVVHNSHASGQNSCVSVGTAFTQYFILYIALSSNDLMGTIEQGVHMPARVRNTSPIVRYFFT